VGPENASLQKSGLLSDGISAIRSLSSIRFWRTLISASKTSIWRLPNASRTNSPPNSTLGLEEYGDYGAVHSLSTFHNQAHQFYFIADRRVKGIDVEAGVGIGVTANTDKLRLKLILSRDLN
jgi:hypothetical protein